LVKTHNVPTTRAVAYNVHSANPVAPICRPRDTTEQYIDHLLSVRAIYRSSIRLAVIKAEGTGAHAIVVANHPLSMWIRPFGLSNRNFLDMFNGASRALRERLELSEGPEIFGLPLKYDVRALELVGDNLFLQLPILERVAWAISHASGLSGEVMNIECRMKLVEQVVEMAPTLLRLMVGTVGMRRLVAVAYLYGIGVELWRSKTTST
ncbi:hypothetical protein GP486_008272, partial [Trichoglossum hirsutum]